MSVVKSMPVSLIPTDNNEKCFLLNLSRRDIEVEGVGAFHNL